MSDPIAVLSSVNDSRPQLIGADLRRHRIRAVVSSAVGTTIEWYDFFLYGIAAATVFPQKFFPASDPFVATLLSFSTFFVGFAARPLGAAVFGHYGDRIGRKALLVTTMVMMGVATMAIGLVPSYEQIGVWGAVFLSVGRVLQGMAVGGEWSGSVLMAGEWTDPKRRGFTTSFAQFGAPAGLVLANGALALMSGATTEADFLAWGWRVPFLASVVLIFVGLYIRLGVLETPVFAAHKARGTLAKAPLVDTLRHHWREVLLSTLLRSGQVVPFYIFTTYIITYTTQQVGYSREMVLNFVMIQSVLSMATIPIMGHLSDTLGRRRVIAFGCVVMMVFPFLYFWMVDTGSWMLGLVAIALGLPIHDIQYGPQAAIIADSFPGSLRYSGSSLGYQFASITAGGPAPIVALLLFREFGSAMAVAAFMAICSLISLAALFALPQRTGELDSK
jgi:metabolite-proton symporter